VQHADEHVSSRCIDKWDKENESVMCISSYMRKPVSRRVRIEHLAESGPQSFSAYRQRNHGLDHSRARVH
jgi:hypothetical protein